jgi:hypothetical protein
MEISIPSGHAPDVGAPRHIPDLRPTADAAALARAPKPELPAPLMHGPPLPPATSLAGAVGRSMIGAVNEAGKSAGGGTDATWMIRTLKPYGINMLPSRDDDLPQQPSDSAPRDDEV